MRIRPFRMSLSLIMAGFLWASLPRAPCEASSGHVHRGHEGLDPDRLGQVAEKAGLESLAYVVRHGVGADGDHRDVAGQRILAQQLQRPDAADAGQVNVHQDHLGLLRASQGDAGRGVGGAQQPHVHAAGNELLDQLQVGRIVFHI